MSNFICEKCGVYCMDTPRGYVSGCEHYPPDAPTRGFGMSVVNGVCQKWYYDKFGAKRWAHDDSLFDVPNVDVSREA